MPQIPLATRTRRAKLEDFRVWDLMTPSPVSLRDGITVGEAAVFLWERGIGAAPVANDAGRPVGVLSRSDVLLAVNAGIENAPVREMMTHGVITVPPDATALDAVEAMVRQRVRRVFVVDGDGIVVGVVSTTDLFRALKSLGATLPPSELAPDRLRPTPPTPHMNGDCTVNDQNDRRDWQSDQEFITDWAVAIPSKMSVRSAADLMSAVGVDVAPLVDTRGRCIGGVFSGVDRRRCPDCIEPTTDGVSELLFVSPAQLTGEVRHQMAERFAKATFGAGTNEIACAP